MFTKLSDMTAQMLDDNGLLSIKNTGTIFQRQDFVEWLMSKARTGLSIQRFKVLVK